MINKTILHLTHTNVFKDIRVIKALDALSQKKEYKLIAFGINLKDDLFENATLDLISKETKVSIFEPFDLRNIFFPKIIKNIIKSLHLNILFIIKGFHINPDLIHCHDSVVLPSAYVLQIVSKCKIIYDAHELEAYRGGQDFFSSFIHLSLERMIWSKVDGLITVSNSINEWYQRKLGKKPSIVILNTPKIFNTKKQPNKNYLKELFKIPKNNKVFIYLGAFVEGRSIRNIIKAFKEIETSNHVIFIGYGKLENLIRKNASIHENIHYHPPLIFKDILSISSSADYGLCLIEPVSLSDYYSLPNKLFEYIFSNLKIIGSNSPEIKLLINKYRLGVTSGFSKKEIINSIKKILVSKDYIKKDFEQLTWNYQEKILKDFYKRLTS